MHIYTLMNKVEGRIKSNVFFFFPRQGSSRQPLALPHKFLASFQQITSPTGPETRALAPRPCLMERLSAAPELGRSRVQNTKHSTIILAPSQFYPIIPLSKYIHSVSMYGM